LLSSPYIFLFLMGKKGSFETKNSVKYGFLGVCREGGGAFEGMLGS
jgi:hypothetical protein